MYIDFDDFTSQFTPWFLFWLRRYIKHSTQCFIGYPNTSSFVKNTPLHVVFSTLFSVFGYPDETLSLVFDIIHQPFFKTCVWHSYLRLKIWNHPSLNRQFLQKPTLRQLSHEHSPSQKAGRYRWFFTSCKTERTLISLSQPQGEECFLTTMYYDLWHTDLCERCSGLTVSAFDSESCSLGFEPLPATTLCCVVVQQLWLSVSLSTQMWYKWVPVN